MSSLVIWHNAERRGRARLLSISIEDPPLASSEKEATRVHGGAHAPMHEIRKDKIHGSQNLDTFVA